MLLVCDRFKDRPVFDEWRRTTEWGKLFDQYVSGPPTFAAPTAPQPQATARA